MSRIGKKPIPLPPKGAQGIAQPSLRQAEAIERRGVHIGYSEIQRFVERRLGFFLILIHEEPAAASETQNRHALAGAPDVYAITGNGHCFPAGRIA